MKLLIPFICRFALKARCNLLPVLSVQKRIKKMTNVLCKTTKRRRQYPETIAHVLNGCKVNAPLILKRLQKATDKSLGTIFIDQKISDSQDYCGHTNQPITIVDVIIPMETGSDAFQPERRNKEIQRSGRMGKDQCDFWLICRWKPRFLG